MTELDANTRRYLDLTRAHNTLASLQSPASLLEAYVNTHVVLNDEAEGEVPLHAALAMLRDVAGAAAVGEADPFEPEDWTRAYAEALAHRLELVAAYAEDIATGARSVRAALAAGLITAPRSWSTSDITGGAMLAYLDQFDEGYGDAAQIWGCIDALMRHQVAGAIPDAVYDRHMRHIDLLWRVGSHIDMTPEHDAELIDGALGAWREADREANTALAEPVPFMQAARAINGADTFARLEHFAADLCGPAWSATAETTDTYDNARQAADRLMIRLAQRYHTMGTDAAGLVDHTGLGERIAQWRQRLFDDAVTFANTIDVSEFDSDTERATVLLDAYERLYRGADVAVTTSELVDLWHAADVLPDKYADQVRVLITLRFEADKPYFGVPIADAGDHHEATRELRRLVDAHDMPSNATDTIIYREHAAALDEIDMHGTNGDTQLITAWAAVVTAADAGTITRRQTAALRDRANARIAEYCDGSEHQAAALAARMPEWDRIGDELR